MNRLWILLVACVGLGGCEDSADEPSKLHAVAPPSSAAPAAEAQSTAAQTAARPAAAGQVSAPATPAAVVERQKAEAGVGKKGRGYGGGIITEPVRQYFIGQDRITFEIQIPEGMKLFQAEHNRYPKDMAEFKRAILDPADIRLPDLPPGDHYVYDAKEHELMVERQVPGGAAE